MIKFLSYLSAFLALVAYILFSLYDNEQNKITALETEKNALKGNIKFLKDDINERNRKIMETSKRVAELEELAKKDKKVFDWNADISNTLVVKSLREN